MEKLFLKACVPEIEKLMPDVGECCGGCMDGLGNHLGRACLADANSFERLFMEEEQMKKSNRFASVESHGNSETDSGIDAHGKNLNAIPSQLEICSISSVVNQTAHLP